MALSVAINSVKDDLVELLSLPCVKAKVPNSWGIGSERVFSKSAA
ncbi:hypothetical protein [Parashewanella spongiae]|nr:hypothetical protein [Parashewanella spongiae]